ncbi:MAG: hypothetical protein ACO1RX_17360 [Candidatus Sericytochromatia bacterium]
MQKIICAGLLLGLMAPAALGHGGESHTSFHQHRLVQGTEVALQLHTRAQYLAYLKQHKLSAAAPAGSHVAVVVLRQGKQWLSSRVKLKLTRGTQVIGPAQGHELTAIAEAAGPHYAVGLTLSKGSTYTALVQFAGAAGIQRAAFEIPAP